MGIALVFFPPHKDLRDGGDFGARSCIAEASQRLSINQLIG